MTGGLKREMKKIMVVDDESIIAMELELHLAEMDYEVIGCASSGAEAIAKAKELRPDLILMDIVMPGEKNGIAAAEEIVSRMDIPIIFLTAYANEEYIKGAKNVGPFGYIVKPYEDRELRATIEIALYKKEMERKLKEEKERVELLTDILGHDISNLNQGIHSYMELLLTTPDFPEKFKEDVRTAFEQSKGITKLVSNVRRLLTIQKQERELKPIDLSSILVHAVETVKSTYSQKEIEIKCALFENEVMMVGNELLEDVFYNILDNAVKYDRHDRVEVEVDISEVEDGNYGKIEFKDHGPGVPDELKERIFTRWERGDKSVFATGLGLMLVKQIVDMCGGSVWVEDRVGGDRSAGSNFVVLLLRGGT
jgi:signal transduction histidine kinase